MKRDLSKAPKVVRSAPLFFAAAGGTYDEETDTIKGLSVITPGVEARGHGWWIDETTCQQVCDEGLAAGDKGIKCHVGHGTLSDDGINRHVGQFTNFSMDKNGVPRADLSFNGLNKDLAEKVRYYATKAPDQAGLSIAAGLPDIDAIEEFMSDNSDKNGEFVSPDKRNKRNLPHLRIRKGNMSSIDAVGSPAANPQGMFSDLEESLFESRNVVLFALGIEDEVPAELSALNIHPSRIKGFVQRILEDAKLEVRPMAAEQEDTSMGNENKDKETPAAAATGQAVTLSLPPEVQAQLAELATIKQGNAELSAKVAELVTQNTQLAALAQADRNARKLTEATDYAKTKLSNIPGVSHAQLGALLLSADVLPEDQKLVLLSVLEACSVNLAESDKFNERGRGGDTPVKGHTPVEIELSQAVNALNAERVKGGQAALSEVDAMGVVFSSNPGLFERWQRANSTQAQ